MKQGVFLINTARGAVIDIKALIKNIDKFGGVGLDVVENEREFGKDHPLLKYKKVILTPHSAYFSDVTAKTIAEKTKQLITNYFK
jgi:lactate dehydrogenase-like 2-hydroxyacid dehydrogenase